MPYTPVFTRYIVDERRFDARRRQTNSPASDEIEGEACNHNMFYRETSYPTNVGGKMLAKRLQMHPTNK